MDGNGVGAEKNVSFEMKVCLGAAKIPRASEALTRAPFAGTLVKFVILIVRVLAFKVIIIFVFVVFPRDASASACASNCARRRANRRTLRAQL